MDTSRRQELIEAATRAYEAAHGNPLPEPARALRWRVTPRVAVTATVVLGAVVVAGVFASRPEAAALVPDAPAATLGGANPGPTWGTAEAFVHVAGAVSQPGLYALASGARVADAVEAAGGSLAEADMGAINLARVVADGEQIYVPAVGETTTGHSAGGLINLNTADTDLLESLPGIGPVLAQRIVDHRSSQGSFTSVEDLRQVSGVGPAAMEAIRDLVTV